MQYIQDRREGRFMSGESMQMASEKSTKLAKAIKFVERVGNKLPHPFILFTIFSLVMLVLSFVLSQLGVGVTYFAEARNANEVGKNVTVVVQNLMSKKSLQTLVQEIPNIYVLFPSLKIVVLMMMSVGFIDKTGFFNTLMRKYLLKAPRSLVTAALIFVAVNGNIMSDAGQIFGLTMGGVIFAALGRNPVIGILAGYAGCSGGFTANLFIAGTDALLAGITEQAVKALGIPIVISPLCNWYFLASATIFLTITMTILTEKVIVKILGDTDANSNTHLLDQYEITPEEDKGLRYALYGFIGFLVIMCVLCLPSGAFFRNAANGFLPKSPLLSSIVPIVFFMFGCMGIPYGIGAGTIKSSRDVPKVLQAGLNKAIPLMVTLVTCSIFIYLVNKSNIFKIIAIYGASIIKKADVGPLPLLILVILITTAVNPMMTSGSTKWILLAPMIVPMLAILDISPAWAQLAYRIGDSSTNIISPLKPEVPIILGLIAEYKAEGKIPKSKDGEEPGFGTIFSVTLPYSIVILLTLTTLMIIWYFLELPIGPGYYLHI